MLFSLVRYFLSPKYSEMEDLSNAAIESLDVLKRTAEARIKYAIEQHETIAVNIELKVSVVFSL